VTESPLRHCTQCGEAQPADARFCPKCGLAVVSAGGSDPVVGKVVADRYLIVEKLGQGTSGTIYRAEHTTLRKKVAVKILHHQLSQDENAIERFRREATTVGQIENDHILQVLDFGRTDDKRLFFAMEFLEGQTLAAAIFKDGKLPIARAVAIAGQVADALVEAHGLGYVHRDLRPRNIFLITRRGQADFVKLLDFGLAKLILPSAEQKQTAIGMTFGDARYMSPEQARGEPIDRRADVYSLGCMLFEMVSGQTPFAGKNTFDVIQKQLDETPPKLRSLRADCPEWLETIVDRALAKHPDGRFVTMTKLVECLRTETAPAATATATPAEKPAGRSPEELRPTAQIPTQRDTIQNLPATPDPMRDTLRDPLKPEDLQRLDRVQEKAKPDPQAKAAKPYVSDNAKTIPIPLIEAPPETAAAPATAAPSQTQALGTIPRGPAPAQPSGPSGKPGPGGKKKRPHVPREIAQVAGNPAMTRSGEVMAQKSDGAAKPPSGPSVVVDGGSTAVAKAVAAADSKEKKPREDTGEWFAATGAFEKSSPVLDDEELYEPRKNRSGLILGGVAGGLGLVVVVVLLLLPKPVKKPLHGEAPTNPPAEAPKVVVTPVDQPTPTAPVVQPVVDPAKPVEDSVIDHNAKPTEAPKVEAPKAAEAPKPAVAEVKPEPKIEPKPEPKIEAKPEPKNEPKPEPKIEPKPEPKVAAKAEPKAAKVAKVDSSPAKSPDGRKKELPDGFRDPFAGAGTKPSPADAAQAEFFVKLGRQKLGSSDLSGAATNFNKAREFDSRSAEAFAGLGEVAFEQGDYNGASVNLKQALKLSPSRARVVLLLGQVYYKMGKPKEAIDQYKRALKLDPNNAEAQHSLELAEKKLAGG